TNIEIDKDFTVAGRAIPKGKYAIFTIPGKKEWTIIINKTCDQHLTDDYLLQQDVVRIKVKPIKQKKITERLQYYIEDDKNGKGKIALAWELLRIEFNVSIKK
ncbi:MAG: DUF2911 domain-containing protein, partial [Ferruginibacter sp.]|nr:DUF2911 domain-containing protein [Ferruginibacter sp.]